MKLYEAPKHTKDNSGIEVRPFQVQTGAKMFDIFCNMIYADKATAILRELGCNAYDAHKAKGNEDEPFDVHLPTSLDPELRIRDYGDGLSKDDIYALFTTLFASSKTASNDYTGCFGMGSKTPFSYRDDFIVESIHNGMISQYACFISEDRIPQVGVVFENKPTTEPSGLNIIIPIRSGDRNDFVSKALKIYGVFLTKPRLNGGDIEVESPEYILTTPNCAVSTYRYDDSRVIMGNVAYDINKNIHDIFNYGVDIFADIGSCSVTSSRDGLKYDNKTKQVLKHLAEMAFEEIRQAVKDKLTQCDNAWDVYIQLNKLGRDLPREVIPKSFIFGNKTITTANYQFDRHVKDIRIFNYTSYYRAKCREDNGKTLVGYEDVVVIYDDLKTGALSRVRHFVSTNEKSVVLVNDKGLTTFINLTSYPRDRVVNASTLDKAPTTTRTRSARAGNKIADVTKLVNCHNKMDSWINTNVTMSKGGYYVPRSRYDIEHDEALHEPQAMFDITQRLCTLGVLTRDTDVFGVRKAQLDMFTKHKKWTNLCSEIPALLIKSNYDFATYERNHLDYRTLAYAEDRFLDSLCVIHKVVPLTDPELQTLVEGRKLKISTNHSKLDAYRRVASFAKVETDLADPVDIEELIKAAIKKYPILALILRNSVIDSPTGVDLGHFLNHGVNK